MSVIISKLMKLEGSGRYIWSNHWTFPKFILSSSRYFIRYNMTNARIWRNVLLINKCEKVKKTTRLCNGWKYLFPFFFILFNFFLMSFLLSFAHIFPGLVWIHLPKFFRTIFQKILLFHWLWSILSHSKYSEGRIMIFKFLQPDSFRIYIWINFPVHQTRQISTSTLILYRHFILSHFLYSNTIFSKQALVMKFFDFEYLWSNEINLGFVFVGPPRVTSSSRGEKSWYFYLDKVGASLDRLIFFFLESGPRSTTFNRSLEWFHQSLIQKVFR